MKLVTSVGLRGRMLVGIAVLGLGLVGSTVFGGTLRAATIPQPRELPMTFDWVACQPNCGGWIKAVGIVTAETPKDFDDFARGRDLSGATVMLDSSGGSVNDAIALGRRWRGLGLSTAVGLSIQTRSAQTLSAQGEAAVARPEAHCESMCVFLLLSGKTRCVPEGAHVRVHQIWMGDRADDAKAASYTAQDLTIVERDVGRLAKYTFDMGGAGDLLSIALSVPPWEELHELSRDELRLTNLVTDESMAEMLPGISPKTISVSASGPVPAAKPIQDRFASEAPRADPVARPARSTRTAEAVVPAGNVAIAGQ